MLLTVQWSRHTINIFVFLQLPPWRWPRDWPKHVGGHYIIKLHHKTKVHLLVFNKFYIRSAILLAAIILPTKLKTQNVNAFVYCVILIFLVVTTKVQFHKLSLYSYHRLCNLGAVKGSAVNIMLTVGLSARKKLWSFPNWIRTAHHLSKEQNDQVNQDNVQHSRSFWRTATGADSNHGPNATPDTCKLGELQ